VHLFDDLQSPERRDNFKDETNGISNSKKNFFIYYFMTNLYSNFV